MEKPVLIKVASFKDERGFFYESYKKSSFSEKGIPQVFIQDNYSVSHKNVIRGMHYQWDGPMGKLVRVSVGEIVDVIVDIRKESPELGKVSYFTLSSDNLNQLYVPPGFAHGFICISETAHVQYKCTEEYNKSGEAGINPFDPDLSINWGIPRSEAIVSNKDLNAISFKEYISNPKF